MASYSYIIKNGTIIDGAGFPMAKGDIGISGEIIKAIGPGKLSGATRVIDAKGKYIMPGVVDITNHSDTHWTLFHAPSQESMLMQGITTILGGVCGSSLAPLTDARAIRAIQKWVDVSTININWKSTGEFFDELGRHNIGVNFGTLVGHGTLRRDIAGDDPRELTKEELESMKLLLRRSLDEGAMGLSLGLATSHGRTVSQEEIIGLSKVVAETGKIISIHLRNEGRRLLSSVVEIVNIARATGAKVHAAHFKAIGKKAWSDLPKALTIIQKAREEEKLDITIDFFPYLRTGSLLYTMLPEWILEGGKERIMEMLTDQSKRESILESIGRMTLHFDNITIAEARRDKHSIGKTILQIAESSGLTPEETLIQLLIVNDLVVTIFGKTLSSRNLVAIAKEPYSIFGSDGVGQDNTTAAHKTDLTHPRSYGAVPRFLNRLSKQNNILSWEDSIKKLTSGPASRLGLEKTRGMLKKGYFADIVIFDPETIKDTATYSDPYQAPVGIDYVFINGHCAIEKGKATGALAGKILRQG